MSWTRSKHKWGRRAIRIGGLKYWISSNSNDYVIYQDDFYFLVKERSSSTNLVSTSTILNEREFKDLKGFVPIKFKKLSICRSRKGRLGKPTWTFGYRGRITPELKEEMERMRMINFREERFEKILSM
ncbi:MAG: hypothetical protein SLAVMIC_00027 [uncultured marine phage]|uniref:Uncharacterized protein n=1 Tax=uncultured marine phage TaxID=707152 RepID=A0A8D9CBD6_9VIRU|nr:MAG: hypothetical protein SLAVMIC_00027 [uncultured marine phage]